jgi:GTP cyclohydrolase II
LNPGQPNSVSVSTSIKVPILGGRSLADVFTFQGLPDSTEHLALGLGEWKLQAIPEVRLHSECLTGDVFGSAKCDCGPQLHEALETFSKVGGVLLYLRQEGRGIGLYNKLAAYALQDSGQDTFQANKTLNFPADMRTYQSAALMLQALGLQHIKLRTNNPDKVNQLKNFGITIEEIIPTKVYANPFNEQYLRAKALKSQHKLDLNDIKNFAEAYHKK